MSNSITINPRNEFWFLVFSTLGESENHIANYLESTDISERFLDDESHLKNLIKKPILQTWSDLPIAKKIAIKYSLQYLLVLDEFTAYKQDIHNPKIYTKEDSLAQDIRNSCQDTLVPNDGYLLCKWIWELLFNNEDWHTDISDWIVVCD